MKTLLLGILMLLLTSPANAAPKAAQAIHPDTVFRLVGQIRDIRRGYVLLEAKGKYQIVPESSVAPDFQVYPGNWVVAKVKEADFVKLDDAARAGLFPAQFKR